MTYTPNDLASASPWKPWFAWKHVVTVSGEKVWLKRIYRRQVRHELVPFNEIEYGNLFDIMTSPHPKPFPRHIPPMPPPTKL